MKKISLYCLVMVLILMASCSTFHLRGQMHLAKPFQRVYLQTTDPYSVLIRSLTQHFKASNIEVVDSPHAASIILVVLKDNVVQQLLSVSSSQQTRQYKLIASATIQLDTPTGVTILTPQTFTQERTITVQSNQILGSSNEASLFFYQMRRDLAYAIMNRLASREVTNLVNKTYAENKTTLSQAS